MLPNAFPDREAIRADQLPKLRRLLQAVAATNPFYGPVLREAGLAQGVECLDAFYAKMPLTCKQQLVDDQAKSPPYGTNLTYPLEDYSRFNQTSATGGQPMRWIDTPESWQWMVDNWKQVFAAAGTSRSDTLYFAFSFGPFLGFWTAMDAATQLGCLAIPGGGLTSLARLEAMRANRATVLLCTPTYAMRLAEVAASEGVDLAETSVRSIVVAGEPGGSVPAVRKSIEQSWPGATLFDHHGMTEVGPVSHQCPEKPGTLMVIESSYLAEILDPDSGRPVAPGELGELVLTTLGRIASPLIRYRTGDLVREDLDVAGRTGRPQLALAGGILDRADDMVTVRGVNVFPSAVDAVLRTFDAVAEYRVTVAGRRAMAELEIEIEPAPDYPEPDELARRVEAKMATVFSLRVPVSPRKPNTLPRFEAKSRRWQRRD